ncbi:hypothetical protein LUZ61_001746 [Rhynchospora tenuis]|uniref:G protein gamma domain-containing protein n=1 Tax=Rhynchospora tenuis TaxID=198213 RepID=A0AAD5ZHK2_9POAL|nr:hypothetical protein LUZ61_001746 [Rhynchospora tenuis]
MGDNGSGNAPPQPKSPPEYPDVCGKHHLKVAVQSLNHEIDYLESELNSMEKTVPASRCCKELNEYVARNPDPLIKVYEKQKKSCGAWDVFRAIVCCSWGSICCTRGCLCCFSQPKRCCCLQLMKDIICCQCCNKGVGCAGCNCCKITSCNLESPCPECSCRCVCSCSRCAKSCASPVCTGCCKGCCLC